MNMKQEAARFSGRHESKEEMSQRINCWVPKEAVVTIFYLLTTFLAFSVTAQTNIPIGTWRLHVSYNSIQCVEVTTENVFAANESGVLVFNREDKTLSTYNKLNGLSSTGITSLKYDKQNDQLLVAYEDGDLDVIKENTITNFNRLKNARVMGSKKINHISIVGNFAYLSTDYGVVLFDLLQLEIKETWRDLGVSGEALPVYQSTFFNDSIFIATAKGVLAGNLEDNLLDYNNWKRFNSGNFSRAIKSIVLFNNTIYAAGPTGVYRYGNGNWILETFLENEVIKSLTASPENLLMIQDSTIWTVNASGQLLQIADDLITSPSIAIPDEKGALWVGDQSAGLVSNTGGTFSSYLPNGPSVSDAFRMVYDNEKLFVLSGGFSSSGQALKKNDDLNIFENGNWSIIQQSFSDLTDIAFSDSKNFLSTFGSGIAVKDASGNITMLDETNSPLINPYPENSGIPAIESSANGLWVANYGGNEPLHLLKSDQSWDSFSFKFPNSQNPTDLSVDQDGYVWMVLNPSSGGGLLAFQPEENISFYKTNAAGNGALPDKFVRCIATDRDGYTWIGTDAGVAYFFSPKNDAVKPIFENRFLLRDERITAIDVDGGNRKWIGTAQGVWLFNATGEQLVHHFTDENSPLLSNLIRDIEINDHTGEVFFATDKGIVSYRSDAVTGGTRFENLKIFPNPVTPGFSGTVGISGLANDAFIKITDISGKLIWQSQANGGMATWNVRDYNGRRAATGIYLVFAATQDGTESMVGKIAVIE